MCEIELDIDDDDDWIKKIEEEDNLYNDFYYEKNENVLVYYLYINRDNEIDHIKQNNIILTDSKIYKEKLMAMLRKNSFFNKIKYSLSSILQYNIDLMPEDVLYYLKKPKDFTFFNRRSISDINWKDSISLFQNLNCLYVVYKERKRKKGHTKKIKIKRFNKTRKSI